LPLLSSSTVDAIGRLAGGDGGESRVRVEHDCVFTRQDRLDVFLRRGGFGFVAITAFVAAAKASSRETTGKPSLA